MLKYLHISKSPSNEISENESAELTVTHKSKSSDDTSQVDREIDVSHVCGLPQVARQSQLLRGVFPVLFHPLPAPVWADDVDNRVNFGMEIGQSACLRASISPIIRMMASDSCATVVSLLPPSGKARGFFKSGHMVIVVTGWIPGSGHTNIMRAVSVP